MNILGKIWFFFMAIGLVYFLVEGGKKYIYRNKFDKHIYSYISFTPNNYYYKNKSQLPKIIIIDKNDKWIHHYQFDLPSEKRAGKPSDVNIIVWLEYSEQFYANFHTILCKFAHHLCKL